MTNFMTLLSWVQVLLVSAAGLYAGDHAFLQ